MTTSQSAPSFPKLTRDSVPLSDWKDILRPKDLNFAKFISLMDTWLVGAQPLTKAECKRLGIPYNVPGVGRTPEYIEVEIELMRQLPIKEDQLYMIPRLLPDLATWFKPPTMRYGWVMGANEIEDLGLLKGQHIEHTIVDYYEAADLPQDVDATNLEFEDGIYEVYRGSRFSAEWTAAALLSLAKDELGLDKRHGGRYPHFTVSNITTDFDQGEDDIVFISIYSNIDLLPERTAKTPLPTSEDIKRMQEWLGLKSEDRDPGWWFSMVGLTNTT